MSVNGVTGPRANVSTRVQSLIQDVKKVYIYFAKGNMYNLFLILLGNTFADHALNLFYFSLQVTNKPVAVGFGISKPEHVKQVREITLSNHLV